MSESSAPRAGPDKGEVPLFYFYYLENNNLIKTGNNKSWYMNNLNSYGSNCICSKSICASFPLSLCQLPVSMVCGY